MYNLIIYSTSTPESTVVNSHREWIEVALRDFKKRERDLIGANTQKEKSTTPKKVCVCLSQKFLAVNKIKKNTITMPTVVKKTVYAGY